MVFDRVFDGVSTGCSIDVLLIVYDNTWLLVWVSVHAGWLLFWLRGCVGQTVVVRLQTCHQSYQFQAGGGMQCWP